MHFPPALSANVLPSSPSSWSWSWKHTHPSLSLNNLFYLSFRNEHHKCRCCFCTVVPFTCWLHRRPHVMFVIRRDMWHRRCWQKWRWWWWQEQNRNPLLHPIGTPTQPQVLSAKEWLLFKLMKVSSSHHRHCHHHHRRVVVPEWVTGWRIPYYYYNVEEDPPGAHTWMGYLVIASFPTLTHSLTDWLSVSPHHRRVMMTPPPPPPL